MRMVEIKNIEYKEFARIRDKLCTKIGFALINERYLADQKIAQFNFWDSDYIPKQLKEFIVNINRKLVEEVEESIGDVIRINKN